MPNIVINKRILNFVINQYLDNSQSSFREAAFDRAETKFDKVKNATMKKFDEHDVTVDLMGGPYGPSVVLSYGNLFSFLGFDSSQTPAENLRIFLQNSIKLNPKPKYKADTRTFFFRVEVPDREDIELATSEDNPPWGAFSSWVYAVEDGVTNLSKYLFDANQQFNNSRSGPALQVKNTVIEGDFSGRDYMTGILDFLNQQF